MMPQIMTIFALFLAIVLASAAAHKLLATERLAAATANLLALELPTGQVLTMAAAALEAIAALALLWPATRTIGAVIAAVLWLAYGTAMLLAHRRGAAFDCGCDFGRRSKAIDRYALWRAPVLAMMAVLVAVLPSAAAVAESAFGALALFSLYLAVSEIAALPSPHRSPAR